LNGRLKMDFKVCYNFGFYYGVLDGKYLVSVDGMNWIEFPKERFGR
jgi:hypothetical protein